MSGILIWAASAPGHTQQSPLIYTVEFTRILEENGLEFLRPADQWLHLIPVRQDSFLQYQLYLLNEDTGNEFRIRVVPFTDEDNPQLARVESFRVAATMATNNPLDSIIVRYPGDAYSRDIIGADRVVYYDFKPKVQFSEKPYGRYLSFFREEEAMVDIIQLSHFPFPDTLPPVPLIRFRK